MLVPGLAVVLGKGPIVLTGTSPAKRQMRPAAICHMLGQGGIQMIQGIRRDWIAGMAGFGDAGNSPMVDLRGPAVVSLALMVEVWPNWRH